MTNEARRDSGGKFLRHRPCRASSKKVIRIWRVAVRLCMCRWPVEPSLSPFNGSLSPKQSNSSFSFAIKKVMRTFFFRFSSRNLSQMQMLCLFRSKRRNRGPLRGARVRYCCWPADVRNHSRALHRSFARISRRRGHVRNAEMKINCWFPARLTRSLFFSFSAQWIEGQQQRTEKDADAQRRF